MSKDKKDKKKKKKKDGKKGGVCRVFVDSENVGNLIPSTLPDNTEVWFFLSDINVYRKVYGLLDDPRFHVVDLLETDNERRREKNEMDLAIIAFIANMITDGVKKKDRYVILSFDKGYDRAIHLLSEENPRLDISRETMSLRQFVEDTPDPRKGDFFKGSLPRDPMLRRKAVTCQDFAKFRETLTPAQRKSLRISQKKSTENGAATWFEYDFYADKYLLFSSGTLAGTYDCQEDGQAEYDSLLNRHKKKLHPARVTHRSRSRRKKKKPVAEPRLLA